MAAAKKTGTVTIVPEVQITEQEYDKEQIVASEKYRSNRDLVEALLDGKKKYTLETVDNLIEKYMKGQVK